MWEWLLGHHIYIVLLVLVGFVLGIVFNPAKLRASLSKYKNIKIGKDGIELNKNDDYKELIDFANGFTERLDKINERLDGLDKRMDVHYEFIKEAAVAAHKGSLWGDQSPPFPEVIYSGLMMLMLGQDGNVVNRIRKCIMGFGDKGVETYQSVLNKFINENKSKLEGNKHFEKHIELVREGIY